MINDISMRIKMFRKKYGLTQQNVADLAGVSAKSISRWESYPEMAIEKPFYNRIVKILDEYDPQDTPAHEPKKEEKSTEQLTPEFQIGLILIQQIKILADKSSEPDADVQALTDSMLKLIDRLEKKPAPEK